MTPTDASKKNHRAMQKGRKSLRSCKDKNDDTEGESSQTEDEVVPAITSPPLKRRKRQRNDSKLRRDYPIVVLTDSQSQSEGESENSRVLNGDEDEDDTKECPETKLGIKRVN